MEPIGSFHEFRMQVRHCRLHWVVGSIYSFERGGCVVKRDSFLKFLKGSFNGLTCFCAFRLEFTYRQYPFCLECGFNFVFYSQHELPHSAPACRFDVNLKPEPVADSSKSTSIGLTSSNKFFAMIKLISFLVKVMSSSNGSSRAMPNLGPPQPACKSILIGRLLFCLAKNSLIISLAFSVTSNIFPPFFS